MKYVNETFTGERSLFKSLDVEIKNCTFGFGESPLKESKDIKLENTSFQWKYPLWYSSNIDAENITLEENARSGIWYSNFISIKNATIDAPKTFRRSKNITLDNVSLQNASETLWNCEDITLKNVQVKGDYFAMNSKNVSIDNMHLDGNYFFDGGENLTITNSLLNSKDSFWNAKNVTVKNSKIIGEYIGWNSKNITFINCIISSHQGFCYMDNVKLIDCEVIDSDLCFEYSKNIDANINSKVISIKNPLSGIIRVKGVDELIQDDNTIDNTKVKIIIEDDEI